MSSNNSPEIQKFLKEHTQISLLRQSKELMALFTYLRDKNTNRSDFIYFADRIIRLLVEEGVSMIPMEPVQVETLTGCHYSGYRFSSKICGVSIMRAGESMERTLRECCRDIRIGKILIQRDEETHLPKHYYSKFSPDIAHRYVLLLDPMLATGGSVVKAVEVLKEHGVQQDKIIFLNLISAPEGLEYFTKACPQVKIVTAAIDDGLNDSKYIVPGLGDFGCRYFGTDVPSKSI